MDAPALVVNELQKSLGLFVSADPFERIIAGALREPWTRDPFDRIIVAPAQLEASLLLSKDEAIRKYYRHALWD